MKRIFSFILKLFFFTGILCISTIAILNLKYGSQYHVEVISAFLLSLVLFLLGFIVTNWSLNKSLKTFMTAVFGGIFVRFVTVAVIVYIVLRYTSLDIIIFISVFVVFYLIYQFFEFRYFNKNVKKGSA